MIYMVKYDIYIYMVNIYGYYMVNIINDNHCWLEELWLNLATKIMVIHSYDEELYDDMMA